MKNYNIITLGASGAGKTVFLASLFKQLSLPTDEGVYLEVRDSEQQKALNQIYAQVANEKLWPRGTTGKVTKWKFTCCVKTQNLEQYPVCQFTYIDYAGGILTDIVDKEDRKNIQYDFCQEVTQADAVIVLIDGQQLLKYIQTDFNLNDNGVAKWLMTDLPNTIQLANCVKKNPVHFVITKWDLFQGKYALAAVRQCLENKCGEFSKLVAQRVNAGCPVRLIPISSVGNEFVTMRSDGSMKKNLRSVPEPFQLEIPLSYLLIDRVIADLNNIDCQDKNTKQSLEYKYRFWFDLVPNILKRGRLLTREERIQKLKKVNDTKTAFSYLIDVFIDYITQFEQNYPKANLGGEMDLANSQSGSNPQNKDSTIFSMFTSIFSLKIEQK